MLNLKETSDMTRIAVPLRKTYAEYVTSEVWRTRRNQCLERDSYHCQGCGSEDDLHAHHRTYDRLGNELPDDIITICRTCHSFIHGEHSRTGQPLDVVTDAVLVLGTGFRTISGYRDA